jgi:hypothetical protein
VTRTHLITPFTRSGRGTKVLLAASVVIPAAAFVVAPPPAAAGTPHHEHEARTTSHRAHNPSPAAATGTASGTSSAVWPSASTTGWQHTGATLTRYTGPSTISTNGTVIDGKNITTCLYITASNVTIKNSRITCAGSSPTDGGTMVLKYGSYHDGTPTGLTLTDVEITRPAGKNGGADYAIQDYGRNLTLTRVNIHNVTSGISFAGGNRSGANGALLQDSYIGGLVNISGSDHNDAVMSNGGATKITLRHNTLEVGLGQTTPIAMYGDLNGPNTYWTVDHNLLNGGRYCIYPSYAKGSEQPNNHITVTNNVFGRKYFSRCGQGGPVNAGTNGASFYDGAGNTWTGNTWADEGATVTVS